MVGGLAALAQIESKNRKSQSAVLMMNYVGQHSTEDPAISRLYNAAKRLQKEAEETTRKGASVNPYDLSSF